MLIAVSGFVSEYWWAVISVPVIAFFVLRWFTRTNPAMRYRVDAIKLNLPWLGPILRRSSCRASRASSRSCTPPASPSSNRMKAAEETAGNLVSRRR